MLEHLLRVRASPHVKRAIWTKTFKMGRHSWTCTIPHTTRKPKQPPSFRNRAMPASKELYILYTPCQTNWRFSSQIGHKKHDHMICIILSSRVIELKCVCVWLFGCKSSGVAPRLQSLQVESREMERSQVPMETPTWPIRNAQGFKASKVEVGTSYTKGASYEQSEIYSDDFLIYLFCSASCLSALWDWFFTGRFSPITWQEESSAWAHEVCVSDVGGQKQRQETEYNEFFLEPWSWVAMQSTRTVGSVFKTIPWAEFYCTTQKLTWNPNIMFSNQEFSSQGYIFRFHVNFRGRRDDTPACLTITPL